MAIISPSTILPLTAAILLTFTAIFVYWRRRQRTASKIGIIVLLSTALVAYTHVIIQISPDLKDKILWTKLQYVGYVTAPTAWLTYSIIYTGRKYWLTPRNLLLLSIVPFLALTLTFTNESHNLVWTSSEFITSTGSSRMQSYGVWTWIFILYSYSILILGSVLHIQLFIHSRNLYRGQATALGFATTIAWLGTIFDTFRVSPLPPYVATSIGFIVGVVIVALTLAPLRRFDILMVSHKAVIESINDGIVVLDRGNHITDLNLAAENLIGAPSKQVNGQSLSEVWPRLAQYLQDVESKNEHTIVEGTSKRTFNVRTSPVIDWRDRAVGHVVVLHDITNLNQRTFELTTLLETTRAISSSLELDNVLTNLAKQMVTVTGANGCTLSHWDQEADAVITWVEYRNLHPEWTDVIGTSYALDDYPATRKVLETGHPLNIHISDHLADPNEIDLMKRLEIYSLLLIPIKVGEQVIGLIELDQSGQERIFKPAEIKLCQAMADQAAVAIEHARLFEEVQGSLSEKETLLQEIHHRVKNNLQIISSLLSLQAQQSQDPNSSIGFVQAQDRVRTMALVHEKLYKSETLTQIDFAEYVRDLAAELLATYQISSQKITLKFEAEPVHMIVDDVIQCGLICNELLSNAIKHAFPGDQPGEICISIKTYPHDQVILIVSDNGIGFPDTVDFRNSASLGLKLVNSLVEQLDGNIQLTDSSGTEFKVTFSPREI